MVSNVNLHPYTVAPVADDFATQANLYQAWDSLKRTAAFTWKGIGKGGAG